MTSDGGVRFPGRAADWLAEQARLREPSMPLVLCVLAVALAGWIAIHTTSGFGLMSGDAHDYSQIARRIASGRGFTTGALYPAELSFGVTPNHPSLFRPPLWSLMIAAGFWLYGPEAWVVHAVLLPFFLGAVCCCALLSTHLAGRVAGVVAGVAVATSPYCLMFTVDGLAEMSVAFWVVLTFLLCAKDVHPMWIGASCGLAYLSHYNAAVLVPAMLLLRAVFHSPTGRSLRSTVAWTGIGFVVLASPWWIRNWIVAGNPFFSLITWVPYLPWEMRGLHQTPLHELRPHVSSQFAVDPIEKFTHLFPMVLAHFPLASMNLAAFIGVVVGCIRRDWLSLAFLLLAAFGAAVASLSTVFGRYFIPYLPVMTCLGVAAWANHGGRLRVLALLFVLAAPLLPAIPSERPDLALLRAEVGARTPEKLEASRLAADRLAACVEPGTLVLASRAPILAWQTDAVVIRLPATGLDFWEIVERHPVRFARVRDFRWMSRSRFAGCFEARFDCAQGFYELRESSGLSRDPPGAG